MIKGIQQIKMQGTLDEPHYENVQHKDGKVFFWWWVYRPKRYIIAYYSKNHVNYSGCSITAFVTNSYCEEEIIELMKSGLRGMGMHYIPTNLRRIYKSYGENNSNVTDVFWGADLEEIQQ